MSPNRRVVETMDDVTCTVCGCVCDDLRLRVADGKVLEIQPHCRLAEPWFQQAHHRASVARWHDREVSRDTALQAAVDLLARSRSPLIFGLSRSTTAGQRAAVRLADQLGANIDTTASVCHGPSIMAIQQVGESTCSLGEVRNRADLVLFWGADPMSTHPRHMERYSGSPVGQFLPGGRQDRTVIVLDKQPTPTSDIADQFLQIMPDRDFEVIWMLRQLVRDPASEISPAFGPTCDALRTLATQLKTCRYGVVFFGLGLARSTGGHANVEALLKLVAELNGYTRFTARRMRLPGDVTGADMVLCWQTGFPFAVNLARRYPRYNPTEYTANELLRREEVDVCVLLGSEAVEWLSPAAQAVLRRIPTIALDYPHQQPKEPFHVQFTTAVYGIHAPGTAYRMDETPLPLRKILESEYPTDADVLSEISRRLNGC